MKNEPGRVTPRGTLTAILTDSHFWVPVIVLVAGLVMLVLFGTKA
jgi:hypothetical protein